MQRGALQTIMTARNVMRGAHQSVNLTRSLGTRASSSLSNTFRHYLPTTTLSPLSHTSMNSRRYVSDDKSKVGGDTETATAEVTEKVTDSADIKKVGGILKVHFNESIQASEEAEESKRKKEGKSKDAEEESSFDRMQRYSRYALMVSVGIMVPTFILDKGRPQRGEDGDVIEDQYSLNVAPVAYLKRSWGELMSVKREFTEPSSKKLLPDPLKHPYYQPKYTVCVELMDIFLHPVYDSLNGWRFQKRPGIEYFLSQLCHPLYEIVIFTKELGMTAYPLIDTMDSKGYIMYRLFRDSARYQSGFDKGDLMNGQLPKLDPYYQKDLRYLNRDLSKVIMIDVDSRACEKNPDNGLIVKPWNGDPKDNSLYDLASLLRTIAVNEVKDVRPVVAHYNQHDDPIEAYKEAQRKMQEGEKLMANDRKENPPQFNFLNPSRFTSWFTQ